METKQKVIKNEIKIITVREMGIFDWKVKEEKKLENEKTLMTFQRNDEVSYINELRELEKEYYSIKKIPLPLLGILAGLSFVFLTLFVVFGIAGVVEMEFTLAMLIFMLPGLLFALALGVLGFLSTKQSISFANEKANRDKIYVEKVKALKNGK